MMRTTPATTPLSIKQKKGRVKQLLTEAISLLCRTSFSFSEELTVEGLIGITVDQEHVLVISMNETLHGKEATPLSWSPETLEKLCSPREQEPKSCDPCPVNSSSPCDPCPVNSSSPSPDKNSESRQAARRKQRKPMQIKEEVAESMVVPDEEEDEEPAEWNSFQKFPPPPPQLLSSVPLDPSPYMSSLRDKQDPLRIDSRLPKADMDPSPGSSVGSSRSPSSHSTEHPHPHEAPILSVPSPQNFYKPKPDESPLLYSDDDRLWVGQVFTGGSLAAAPLDLTTKDEALNCRKRYRTKDMAMPHVSVRCPVCRKSFDSRIKYNRHKRSHRGIFTCKVCGRSYNRKDNMQRHYKLYHAAFLEAQGMPLDDGFTVSQQSPLVPEGPEEEHLVASP